MPQNLSAQIVCPSPKVWDFDEKRLHLASVVRALMDALSSPSPVKTDTNSILRFVEKENVVLCAYGSKNSIT
jgi:hypothetical protein